MAFAGACFLMPRPVSHYRTVIIDDQQPLVDMLLRATPDLGPYQVVGSATSARVGITLVQQTQPDLIILDLVMPEISGLAILEAMRNLSPTSRVLIFSGNLSPEPVRAAFVAGAFGFVDKAAGLDELRVALQSVAAGKVYLGTFASEVVKSLVVGATPEDSSLVELSTNERLVLQHLANGHEPKEIATLLDVSLRTVLKHRRSLMRKTGLRRTAQLPGYAMRLGLGSS